jgi:hypothetical protein
MNVLSIVQKEFSIDEDRIYLMGHSMGGAGTMYLGAKYPEIWAALAPISPALFFSFDILKRVTHLPLMVLAGDQDKITPVQPIREFVEVSRSLGMNVGYCEVKGAGHLMIQSSPQWIAAVFDFLEQHRRSPFTTGEASSVSMKTRSLPISNIRDHAPCKRRNRRMQNQHLQVHSNLEQMEECVPITEPDMGRLFLRLVRFRLWTILTAVCPACA